MRDELQDAIDHFDAPRYRRLKHLTPLLEAAKKWQQWQADLRATQEMLDEHNITVEVEVETR